MRPMVKGPLNANRLILTGLVELSARIPGGLTWRSNSAKLAARSGRKFAAKEADFLAKFAFNDRFVFNGKL
jgi:hypothetical protein